MINWISVKDKLPKLGPKLDNYECARSNFVLAIDTDGDPYIARYVKGIDSDMEEFEGWASNYDEYGLEIEFWCEIEMPTKEKK